MEKFVESRPTCPKNGEKYKDAQGNTHMFLYGTWKKLKNTEKKNSFNKY